MSTNSTTQRSSFSLWFGRLLATFGVLFVLLVVLIIYLSMGTGTGTELNVTSWKTRHFSYVKDPLTGWQVTGIQHDDLGSPDPTILSYLSGGPAAPTSTRWDLISIHRSGSDLQGEASIFDNYVQLDTTEWWIDWSKGHPSEAKLLWGAVRDLVHLNLYPELPSILELVSTRSFADQLPSKIKEQMVTVVEAATLKSQKDGDTNRALLCARVGATYGQSPVFDSLLSKADGDDGATR